MTENILHRLQNNKFLVISVTDLKNLLKKAELLLEANTYLSDYIRILLYDNHVIIQEQTQKGEIIVREQESLEKARIFLANRMEIYEKMWNGCGCKVGYFE
jgi:hypothetical protein